MENTITAQLLARALKDDRLAVLVGSGASCRSTDQRGRQYQGLPTPSEFVKLAARYYTYVSDEQSFNEVCNAIRDRERRAALEEILLRYYDVPEAFEAPPAHRILSWLPFSLYITSNYDQFIERSLAREGRRPFALIENSDLIRMRADQTAVIKYHGCVSRPSTMVAASDDYEALERRRNLVSRLISVSLAGKSLLIIGHSLNDWDLSKILHTLKDELGEYAPAVFVVKAPGSDGRLAQSQYNVEVVTEDLTQFLNRLLLEYRQLHQTENVAFSDEQWLSSAFFATLRQAAVLPSETQVIDAFLKHLLEEMSARGEVSSVKLDASAAVNEALRERPNYVALARIWGDLQEALASKVNDLPGAERAIETVIQKRQDQVSTFRDVGFNTIKSNERILLFSQSQRVLQALKGVPQSRQRTCQLFVAECRPKSPLPYQDAIAISKELTDTFYAVTICPDVVAQALLETGQIDRIVMGAHAVYVSDKTEWRTSAHSFVNTCGSEALVILAKQYNIPVLVIAEQLKLEEATLETARDHMFFHQESDLLERMHGLSELFTRREQVGHLNIGYDLVELSDGVSLVVPDALEH